MMTAAEARDVMLADIASLQCESVPLDDAFGRVLAADAYASRNQPPFEVSAMDGYAVRANDTPGDLLVCGESAAGRGFAGAVAIGTAVRISTGAALPRGADTIVMQEDVRREEHAIHVPALRQGQHIRRRGGDFSAGERLLARSRVMDGIALSMAAAAGYGRLDVMRQPRVMILSSGDELIAPGNLPGPWQIFDSVTFGVAGMARKWGAQPRRLALVPTPISGHGAIMT